MHRFDLGWRVRRPEVYSDLPIATLRESKIT
jgi:hypothetical protein